MAKITIIEVGIIQYMGGGDGGSGSAGPAGAQGPIGLTGNTGPAGAVGAVGVIVSATRPANLVAGQVWLQI